jgi:hypothetical protein
MCFYKAYEAVIFTALAALKLSPTFLDENSLKV